MRSLVKVIDDIVKVAPDLHSCLAELRETAVYSAPEIMNNRWSKAAGILNMCASEHPKRNEIAAIFAGQPVNQE